MPKLIYMMCTSVDGCVANDEGAPDFGPHCAPNEAINRYINECIAPVSGYLYGRKMYDMMVYWETPDRGAEMSSWHREFMQMWQAAEKVVYSRTLAEPRSARTRIERAFDPEAVRRLKSEARGDLTISGPELAAQALRAGLVDEIQMFVFPVVIGRGKRFFPEGVRLELELVEERRFAKGEVALRYGVRSAG